MATSRFLDFSTVKPVGVPSTVKMAKFTPQSAYGAITATDTIRFQINSPGFWDPYSAYFNLEVETFDLPAVGGFSQIDGSAHSFINQLIIYSKGVEIERIQEYDGLAEVLSSVTYSGEQRAARKHEGYGSKTETPIKYGTGGQSYNPVSSGAMIERRGFTPIAKDSYSYFSDEISELALGSTNSDYIKVFTNSNIPEKIRASKSQFGASGFTGGIKSAIGLERADDLFSVYNSPAITGSTAQFVGHGMVTPHSAALGNGCNEPRFGPRLGTIAGGIPSPVRQVTKQQFSIPILSGLLGVLMPRESYKYVPMGALEDVIIEIKLNKYALFSSGYNEDRWSEPITASFDNDNPFEKVPTTQISRNFRITKFELMADIILFDREITDRVMEKLDSEQGIVLHSCSWYLGPQFNIASTSAATGTWQINMGFESLKSLIFYYELNDYNQYNFCRKHFRVSRNLTYLQLKIGIDYYPTLAIEGHGGCLANTFGTGNNSEYLINTYKAFNKLFDAVSDNFLNSENFALNNRVYDPTKTGKFYDSGTKQLVNTDTALGLPGFWENTSVGRAVYGLNLEGLKEEYSMMSGINTIVNRPFELNLRSDGINDVVNDRPATMYVFCYYDFIVRLTKSKGVEVLGRG